MKKETIKKGDKFGKLTAIRFDCRKNGYSLFWLFECSCGNKKTINVGNVKSNGTRSCGCLKRNNLKHGMRGSSTYQSWAAMKQRCLNKNRKDYKYWGGRGIKICDEWIGKDGFINFFRDMGHKPKNKSIDRIDNEGNYEPKNCKWSTVKEQNNNKRISAFR